MIIYKYDLEIDDDQTIVAPVGSKWLYVGVQNNNLKVWLECPETSNMETRYIKIKGTGNPWEYNADFTYIGTVQLKTWVWHVYGD